MTRRLWIISLTSSAEPLSFPGDHVQLCSLWGRSRLCQTHFATDFLGETATALLTHFFAFLWLQTKEQLIASARKIATSGQDLARLIRIIAKNCIDPRCSQELLCVVEQIQTMSNQLRIISR